MNLRAKAAERSAGTRGLSGTRASRRGGGAANLMFVFGTSTTVSSTEPCAKGYCCFDKQQPAHSGTIFSQPRRHFLAEPFIQVF